MIHDYSMPEVTLNAYFNLYRDGIISLKAGNVDIIAFHGSGMSYKYQVDDFSFEERSARCECDRLSKPD
jgi:hypothetical protein